MEWIIIIFMLLTAFIPILHRINQKIYEMEQNMNRLRQQTELSYIRLTRKLSILEKKTNRNN